MADEPMDQYEIEEGLKQLGKFEQLARIRMQQQAYQNQQKQADKALSKALNKAGLTPDDWNRITAQDPQGTLEAFKDHVKSYVKTVVKSRGQQKEPKGRIANARVPRQAESRSRGDFQELREKAHKGTITEEEQMHALEKMLGWDR